MRLATPGIQYGAPSVRQARCSLAPAGHGCSRRLLSLRQT